MVPEGQIHDVISAAKDNLVIPRLQMAAGTIMKSSERWPSSVVQNPDLRDFSASTEYTQLMTASSRTYLNLSYNLSVVTQKMKLLRTAILQHWDEIFTGKRTLITDLLFLSHLDHCAILSNDLQM